MEFNNLLDDCVTLENTISILLKSNASKHADLTRLQNCIFEQTQEYLDESLKRDAQLSEYFDGLKFRKDQIDLEVKKISSVNEKLSELVAVFQKANRPEVDEDNCKYDEYYYSVADTITEYEQILLDRSKIMDKLEHLGETIEVETKEVSNLLKDSQDLAVSLQRNDNIIRLSHEQNKYAEQQFDLILNQIPWEPLTGDYISELRNSDNIGVKNFAEVIQIQANEIEDLNESLKSKKQKKLQVLEELLEELNSFIKTRDEAVLVTHLSIG